jgi:hypothetical protein
MTAIASPRCGRNAAGGGTARPIRCCCYKRPMVAAEGECGREGAEQFHLGKLRPP